MLGYALLFFLLALGAAFVGFGGFVAGSLMLAAKVCLFVFLILFVIALFAGRRPNDPYV